MINAFIFLLHILFVIYIFIKIKKSESLSAAFFNLFLIVILFSVGWAFLNFAAKLFLDPQGYSVEITGDSPFWFILKYAGMWMKKPGGFTIAFTIDKITLIILTVIEFFFYKKYYKDIIAGGKGK